MSGAILTIRRLSYSYGETVALNGIDLEVERGEMFGLIGPDGAGKTTTLRLALGLLRPGEGELRTCDLEPHRSRRALSHRVGYLSQRFSLYGDLSVEENLAFFARIHGVRDHEQRGRELLEWVRLASFRKRLADRLSGGMKQKLALACTLIHRPELLILDEPTTGVDPVSRRDFWKLLTRLQGEGLTLVMTTPYLDEAERCGRVAFLHEGRLLAVDDPQNLRRNHPGLVIEVVASPRKEAAELLRRLPGVRSVEAFGDRLHVNLKRQTGVEGGAVAGELTTALCAAGIDVAQARPVLPSLEDVFIHRVREALGAVTPDYGGVT